MNADVQCDVRASGKHSISSSQVKLLPSATCFWCTPGAIHHVLGKHRRCFRCALVLWWQTCHSSASQALVPRDAAPRGRQFPDIIALQNLYYNYSIGAILNIAILKWCSPVHECRLLTVLPLPLPFCSCKKCLASSGILLCVIRYQGGLEKLPPGALTALLSRLAKKCCVVYHILWYNAVDI